MVLDRFLVHIERKLFGTAFGAVFEVGKEAFVGEIEGMGIFPIVLRHFVQPLDDIVIVNLDRQFAPTVPHGEQGKRRSRIPLGAACE